MKSVYFSEINRIEVKDVDEPQIRKGTVKVKIAYAALCATDLHMVTMGILGAKPGIGLGHEASGTIVELGDGVEKSGLKVGDKVVMAPIAVCGKCDMCKRGMPQYCRNAEPIAAFSEYVVTESSAVFRIPDDADMQRYSLTEPSVCTVRAMDIAQIHHGDTVVVSGIGGIGSILLNMVLLSGASRITVIDPVKEKRELALTMGASYALDPMNDDVYSECMKITDGAGFDRVFEMSGSPSASGICLKIVAHCGKVIYFAVYPPAYEMPLNLYDLYMKEASIHTVFTSHSLYPRTINLMERLQTDKIIGKVMKLEDAVEAFELFKTSRYPKILLKC